MDDRLHLHEGEHLLLSARPSLAFLVRGFLRSLAEGFLLAIVLSVFFNILLGAPLVAILLLLWAIVAVLFMMLRCRHWRHALLRVTTERILLQYPETLLSLPLRTIKWNQYQESFFGTRDPLDLLFRVRTLVIRYGALDSKLYASFPAIPLAQDVKHYLDKVDSAIRRGEAGSLRPFVFKRRGERGEG